MNVIYTWRHFIDNFSSQFESENMFIVLITKLMWSDRLTHWGRVTHICINKLTIIGLDNGSLTGRHQAIICTNVGILLIGPLGTNFSEILIKIHIFSFKKMHLKMSPGNCQPFCLNLNVLKKFAHDMIAVQIFVVISCLEYITIIYIFYQHWIAKIYHQWYRLQNIRANKAENLCILFC